MSTTDRRGLTLRSGAMAFGFALSAPGAMGGALLLAPLWALVGPLAAPWRDLPALARKAGLPLTLFAAFFLWVHLSMLWAPEYNLTLSSHNAGGVATGILLVAAFSVRREAPDSRLIRTSAIACAFGMLCLGAIEIFLKVPIARLFQPDARVDLLMRGPMKGMTVMAVTLWGPTAMLWARGQAGRRAAVALALGAAILAFYSDMDANALALLCGLAGFGLGLRFGSDAFRIAGLMVAASILLAPIIIGVAVPLLSPLQMPDSWDMRVMIWREALVEILRQPLFGTGFGSFRNLALSFDFAGEKITAQHAHNAALQIWFETGLVGAALAAGALGVMAWRAGEALRGDRIGAAAATATIAALTPIAFLSWAIWQEWWVATLFLAGGLAAAARAPAAPPS